MCSRSVREEDLNDILGRGIDRGAATPSEERRRGLGGVAVAPVYLPAVTADVSTLMVRVAVPLRHGRTFDPFGSVGVGLARATRPPPPGESLRRTDTQFGIEAGGGATAWLTSRIGLRTAATYYKALGPPGLERLTPGFDSRAAGRSISSCLQPSPTDPQGTPGYAS